MNRPINFTDYEADAIIVLSLHETFHFATSLFCIRRLAFPRKLVTDRHERFPLVRRLPLHQALCKFPRRVASFNLPASLLPRPTAVNSVAIGNVGESPCKKASPRPQFLLAPLE